MATEIHGRDIDMRWLIFANHQVGQEKAGIDFVHCATDLHVCNGVFVVVLEQSEHSIDLIVNLLQRPFGLLGADSDNPSMHVLTHHFSPPLGIIPLGRSKTEYGQWLEAGGRCSKGGCVQLYETETAKTRCPDRLPFEHVRDRRAPMEGEDRLGTTKETTGSHLSLPVRVLDPGVASSQDRTVLDGLLWVATMLTPAIAPCTMTLSL